MIIIVHNAYHQNLVKLDLPWWLCHNALAYST